MCRPETAQPVLFIRAGRSRIFERRDPCASFRRRIGFRFDHRAINSLPGANERPYLPVVSASEHQERDRVKRKHIRC